MSNGRPISQFRRPKKGFNGMLLRSDLKDTYGWTDKLIDTFLPSSDKSYPNKYGTMTKLYSERRVLDAMRRPEFPKAFKEAQKVSARARRAVDTKCFNAMDLVDAIDLRIPSLTKQELHQRSCDWWNRGQRVSPGEVVTPEDGDELLDPLSVMYLHNVSNGYRLDPRVAEMRAGKSIVLEYLNLRVYQKISEVYPWLKHECEVQWRGR
jgi:hypothetical protein